MQNNVELKELAKRRGLPLWKVADTVGVSEFTLVRWLRKPVTDERYDQISKAIEKAAEDAGEEKNNE